VHRAPQASPRLDKPGALATLASQLDAVASAVGRAALRSEAAPEEDDTASARLAPAGAGELASPRSSPRSGSPAAVSACSSPDTVLEDALEELPLPNSAGDASPRSAASPRRHARPPATATAPFVLPWQRPPAPAPPLGPGTSPALNRWGAAAAADEDDDDNEYAAALEAERERASVASTPSAASKQRAVAEWVESTSPLTQPRLSGGGRDNDEDASPPWGGAWRAPASPAGWEGQGTRPVRRSPARRRGRDRGALSLAEGDAAAALGRLLDDVADVKRALLSPQADAAAAVRRSPPPVAAAPSPQPRVRASPDRPGVLPPEAWMSSRRATPPQQPQEAASPRSGTRRSALLQQLGSHAAAELEGFSFPADRNRAGSPELWRPEDSPAASPAQHTPHRQQPRHGRAGSERSDTEASAPSEMVRNQAPNRCLQTE
jgi:hypothetical protein